MSANLPLSSRKARILAPRDPVALVIACVALVLTFASARQQGQFLDVGAGPRLVLAGLRGQRPPASERDRIFQWVAEEIPPEAVVIWMPWDSALVLGDPLFAQVSAGPIANYYLRPRRLLSSSLETVPAPPMPFDTTGACLLWEQHRHEVTWLLQHERYAPSCPGMEFVRVVYHEPWRLVQLRAGT